MKSIKTFVIAAALTTVSFGSFAAETVSYTHLTLPTKA